MNKRERFCWAIGDFARGTGVGSAWDQRMRLWRCENEMQGIDEGAGVHFNGGGHTHQKKRENRKKREHMRGPVDYIKSDGSHKQIKLGPSMQT